jgi:hypothetical protein
MYTPTHHVDHNIVIEKTTHRSAMLIHFTQFIPIYYPSRRNNDVPSNHEEVKMAEKQKINGNGEFDRTAVQSVNHAGDAATSHRTIKPAGVKDYRYQVSTTYDFTGCTRQDLMEVAVRALDVITADEFRTTYAGTKKVESDPAKALRSIDGEYKVKPIAERLANRGKAKDPVEVSKKSFSGMDADERAAFIEWAKTQK